MKQFPEVENEEKKSQSSSTMSDKTNNCKIAKYRKIFIARSQFKMRKPEEIKAQERH